MKCIVFYLLSLLPCSKNRLDTPEHFSSDQNTNARDTQSDKMLNATSWMENHTVCRPIRFLSYGVGWNAFRSI